MPEYSDEELMRLNELDEAHTLVNDLVKMLHILGIEVTATVKGEGLPRAIEDADSEACQEAFLAAIRLNIFTADYINILTGHNKFDYSEKVRQKIDESRKLLEGGDSE